MPRAAFTWALLCLCLLWFTGTIVRAATWTPDPSLSNPELHKRLYDIGRNFAETNFDPDAKLVGIGSTKGGKGRLSYRESAYYAYGLLLTGDATDRALAQEVLKLVVAAQDTRPASPSYGAFLWYSDQNWDTLKDPDLNTAEFIGLALANVIHLDRRHSVLDPEVRSAVETACHLAVEQAMRRNADANYSNIALLSTALTAAGGQLFKMPDAELFAQSKLDTLFCLAHGGVCYEYLCPTYGAVDLQGAYLARKFAFSDAFATKADAMIDNLWSQIASAYHAPTYQLAGPFGRAYGDDMLTYAAGAKYFLYLALGGDYPLAEEDPHRGVDQCGLMMNAELPITPRPEFKLQVPAWREFSAIAGGAWPERRLRQYRENNFILGTVDFQDEWPQKRNLVAYWRTDIAEKPGYRIGFCIDESNETFAAGFHYGQVHFYSCQLKGSALVALVTSSDVPAQGSCALVFDHQAAVADQPKLGPLQIADGSVTAYLYPVSSNAAGFETNGDGPTFRVTRQWATADTVGSLHVLAYIITFQPTGQPAPTVADLVLQPEKEGASARAKVDGAELSVSFSN